MTEKKFFLSLFRVLCFLSHLELLLESRDVQESLNCYLDFVVVLSSGLHH